MADDIRGRATELAKRPYTEVIFRDRTTDGDYVYVAVTPELEGCLAQGETVSEARGNLGLFRIDYIQHMLEHNIPVPDPAWIHTSAGGDGMSLNLIRLRSSPADESNAATFRVYSDPV